MLPTSIMYKSLVYSTTEARQFVPRILMKMMDLIARDVCTYTASSEMYYSKLTELYDDVHMSGNRYRTLETNNFLLDGLAQFLPTDGSIPPEQIGWVSENLSNENGEFEDEWVICEYSSPISTPGKTIFFDENFAAHPVDIDLYYYRDDELLGVEEVRNIDRHFAVSYAGYTNYNKLRIQILKMNLPFTRVRIIEDVPGLYVQYTDKETISMTLVQSVDLFSEELITGEFDLTVKNEDKILDILNPSGKEQYLQKKQAMEVGVAMVFPGGSQETIPLGTFFLASWRSDPKTLSASFTARDGLDRLRGEYIKGAYYPSLTSFYALAEDVLLSAGITEYEIDPVLLNLYTMGIIPIVSHREALRLIAQATCSVVLPLRNGGVKIRYVGIPSQWPVPVDELDFNTLIDEPEVSTVEPIKSISVDRFSYTPKSGEPDEVYKGTHKINGTSTFTIKFSRPVQSSTITVTNGTLVTHNSYTQAAELTVVTDTEADVEILVKGVVIEKSATTSTLDNLIDTDLVEDAEEIVINNPLVTTEGIATALLNYTAYWKKRRYEYDFDWRGNPAMELLDPVRVHDAFNRNNTTLITRRNLAIQGGVLEETSKAVF